MKLLDLLLFFIAFWVLTHFWLVPLVRKSWQMGDLKKKIARVSALTLLEKIRDLCGVGSITLVLLVVFIWIMSFLSEGTIILSRPIIDFLTSLYHIAKSVAIHYGKFLIWFGILGSGIALFLSGRTAKNKVITAWTAKAEEVKERLLANPEELDFAGDDHELRDIVDHLYIRIEMLSTIQEEGDEGQIEQIQDEIDSLLTIVALEKSKRELNVEEALGSPAQPESEESDKTHLKLLRILASERLSKDLGLLSRPLSFVTTCLLLISLTGWVASPLANSLQLAVNNLRIHVLQDDADRYLSTAISHIEPSPSPPVPSPPVNVAQTSRLLARVAQSQINNSALLERSAGLLRQGRSESVRASILQQTVEPPSNGTTNQLLNQIEKEIKPEVERLHRRNPGAVGKLLERLKTRYATTLNPLNAQSNLISSMVSQSFDILNPGDGSEIAKHGRNIAKDVGKKAANTWANIHPKALMAEILLDQSRSKVSDNLHNQFRFEMSSEGSTLIRNISETKSDQMSKRLAASVAKSLRFTPDAPAIRNLAGYSEIFPRVGEEVLRSGKSIAKKIPSTNFRMASRSFKVRGVLFGRDLQSDSLNVTDIEWSIDEQDGEVPTMLSLSLTIDGERRPIGSFPAGIVNQALRYAADQRVVATTITSGDGEIIGRVTYLHPVLEDTPLGCRVVEADRFIDQFTDETLVASLVSMQQVDSHFAEVVGHRAAINNFLIIAKIAEVIARGGINSSVSQLQVQDFIRELDLQSLSLPIFRDNMEKFLTNGLDSDKGSTDFIDRVFRCTERDSIAKCLDNFSGYDLPATYWFPEDHTSQFREKDTKLDSELSWLKRSDSRFGHFDLWLHTTFAVRRPGDESGDESTATPMDFPTSQIKILNEVLIENLIRPYLKDKLYSPSYDAFMSPLEDFVILQRLFRAALNGQLDDNFPLEKLIDLERRTREFVPHQPTIRWEPADSSDDPDSSKFFKVLRETSDDAHQIYIDSMRDQLEWIMNKRSRCADASL